MQAFSGVAGVNKPAYRRMPRIGALLGWVFDGCWVWRLLEVKTRAAHLPRAPPEICPSVLATNGQTHGHRCRWWSRSTALVQKHLCQWQLWGRAAGCSGRFNDPKPTSWYVLNVEDSV